MVETNEDYKFKKIVYFNGLGVVDLSQNILEIAKTSNPYKRILLLGEFNDRKKILDTLEAISDKVTGYRIKDDWLPGDVVSQSILGVHVGKQQEYYLSEPAKKLLDTQKMD